MVTLYHGTNDAVADLIKILGLCPPALVSGIVRGAEQEVEHSKKIFFAYSKYQAETVANQTVYSFGGKPVVVSLDTEDLPKGTEVDFRFAEAVIKTDKCISPKILEVEEV